MRKREFKVGDVFQFGLIKLKCEKGHGCNGCYFFINGVDDCTKIKEFVGECFEVFRENKDNVVFVEVED